MGFSSCARGWAGTRIAEGFVIATLACFVHGTPGRAAPINPVPYGSLTVPGLVDFESVGAVPGPGINFDSVLTIGGASFGERFDGQTTGLVLGNHDSLSGSPTGPLLLVPGLANQNVLVGNSGFTSGIAGLGPDGYPLVEANGEGALSVLLAVDTSEFGFEALGTQSGSMSISFFRRDGSLIENLSVGPLSDGFYAFAREGAVVDIAGVSITNDDPQGFGFDNFRFDVVPEPGTGVLLLCGLAWLSRSARSRD